MAMRLALAAIAMVASLALVGCQSGSPPSVRRQQASPPGQSGTADSDRAVISDPCAAQLHDICGALLLYYALNKHLPPKLEDLRTMADVDAPLIFECPVSHQAYGYSRVGLSAPNQSKRIIVYDATPCHDGRRWCILLAPVQAGGSTVSVEVLSIPERVFQIYQSPASAPPAPEAP